MCDRTDVIVGIIMVMVIIGIIVGTGLILSSDGEAREYCRSSCFERKERILVNDGGRCFCVDTNDTIHKILPKAEQ